MTAHESELLLGNEAFIDRIVREDGGFAEKIVSRVLSLDKAFAKLGDKESKAQHKLVRQAERLYLKAAEAAGNGRIARMILSQTPKLEEEVQFSFEDGKNEADQELVDFYNAVLSMQDNNAKNKRKKRIGTVSEAHATLVSEIIKKETGKEIDLSGYEIWINGGAVTHIEERHGKEGKADHSMADEQNIARIPWAMDGATSGEVLKNEDGSFDLDYEFKNSDQTPSYKVRVSRQVDNGLLFVAECVPDSVSKQLHVISAYMQKSDKGQELYGTDNSPKPTAEPHLDSNVTDNSIAQNPEKSTETTEKDLKNEKKVQMSLAEAANQQTSGDIDEVRELSLQDLYDMDAEDFDVADAPSVRINDWSNSEENVDDPKKTAKNETPEKTKEAPKKEASDEPQPKKTGYTYNDIHGMMDEVKKGLTFELPGGKEIEGLIHRNDEWDANKKIYQALKASELRKKRDLARDVAELIFPSISVRVTDSYGKKTVKKLSEVLDADGAESAKEQIALDVAVQLGDKEAMKYSKRMGELKHEAKGLSDMEKGRYVNAANYKGDTFKKVLSELSRLNWRGGLVSGKKMRERLREEILSRSAFADKKDACKRAQEAPKRIEAEKRTYPHLLIVIYTQLYKRQILYN